VAGNSSGGASASDREIVITRVLNAPRELVFEAMTDPKQVGLWWGPRGFSTTIHEMDVRPGGVWKLTMHGPDGTDYPNKSVFLEIVKPERVVYSHGGGSKGGPGANFKATWTFEKQGDKTKLTMRMEFPTADARDQVVKHYNAIEGGNQTLDRCEEHLSKSAGAAVCVISRIFAAPRDLVFKAWTEPERLKHWWGPKGFTMLSAKVDLRPGGVFHYGMRAPNGQEMWGKFTYREIAAPERLVFIVSFSDEKGGVTRHPMSATWPLEVLSTVIFSDQDGRTTLTNRGTPNNATDAERKTFEGGFAGMQMGFKGTFDQLADYLAKG
jgi:uncharacterized protein YndB with AHSA1/START domain